MKRDDATGDLFGSPARRAPELKAAGPKLGTVAATVYEIAELIRDPGRWCQGCSARDQVGRPIPPDHARTLSAYGAFALLRSNGRVPDGVALRVWMALDAATAPTPFARWHDNPTTTHAEVMAMLRLIAESEAAVPSTGG